MDEVKLDEIIMPVIKQEKRKRVPQYAKAVVYALICHNAAIEDMYIGSTFRKTERKCNHKTHCINEKDIKYNFPVYQFIRENGGWENWKFHILDEFKECKSRIELEQREQKFIQDLKPTLNSRHAIDGKRREYYQKYHKTEKGIATVSKAEANRKKKHLDRLNNIQLNEQEIALKNAMECNLSNDIISV